MGQLYPEAELTDEERAALNAESETIWAEINALETALAAAITVEVGVTLGEGYQVVLEVKLKEAAAKKKLCAAVKQWNTTRQRIFGTSRKFLGIKAYGAQNFT